MTRDLPPLYVLPGNNPGLVIRGNIDINDRPPVRFRGGIATVRSTSFDYEADGKTYQVLIPTVVGKRVVSNQQAYHHYAKTGKHLGVFDSIEHADAYGIRLHNYHARIYAHTRPVG